MRNMAPQVILPACLEEHMMQSRLTEGWNYIVRMYKPGPEISGDYQFPVFEPVN